jgi:3-hydroxyisobutyrate dehydrogenase-like beta-hydroxyacid dehydrogenase
MLRQAGYRVVTALDGRSTASRNLAEQAGLEDLGSLEQLFAQCSLFLSILPPAVAFDFAQSAARVIGRLERQVLYVDCNAVSPATVDAISALFSRGAVRFVDVGIVGPAPKSGTRSPTRFYVAGPDRATLLDIEVPELAVIDMGATIGRASAIKMCYAGLNKGVDALYTTILLAAERLGVRRELMQEFDLSQAEAAGRMARRVPFLAAAADRFTGEMAEIAATFDSAGVSGDFHRGAEWLYARLAESTLAVETRATLPTERSLDDALTAFAAVLKHG